MILRTSLLLLMGFFVTAGIDGLYFHLIRYRLWARAESRLEHALHSVRALLLPPTLWALYLADRTSGLYVAAGLLSLDVVATVLDVLVEPKSRKGLGGLPRGEIVLHVVATVFHVGAIALAIVAKVSGASAAHVAYVAPIVTVLVVLASLGAVHHVALAFYGSPSRAALRGTGAS